MNISEASKKIELAYKSGLISEEESKWFQRMIRRTGDYGNKWSFKKQSQMRDNLLKDFA